MMNMYKTGGEFMGYETKLKYSSRKRRNALIAKKQLLRKHLRNGTIACITASIPLLYIILFTPDEGQVISQIANHTSLPMPSTFLFILGITVEIISLLLLVYSMQQYKKEKKKYDEIRRETMNSFSQPICNCNWSECTCKDDFIEEMDKK
jgi:hypothetical protein